MFFLKIIEHLNLNPSKTLTIGNNFTVDYQASMSAGINCCLIKYKSKNEVQIESNKAIVIDNIKELTCI